jgi:hypothetical protein
MGGQKFLCSQGQAHAIKWSVRGLYNTVFIRELLPIRDSDGRILPEAIATAFSILQEGSRSRNLEVLLRRVSRRETDTYVLRTLSALLLARSYDGGWTHNMNFFLIKQC